VRKARQSGFTILELMITVAIMGVVLAFAVPNINDFFDKKRVIKLAEAIYSDMLFARAEAISSASNYYIAQTGGITVTLDRTSDTDWKIGTSVTITCDPDQTDPTAADACYVIKDDDDGIIDGADIDFDGVLDAGEIDADDRVIRVVSSVNHPGTKLLSSSTLGSPVTTQLTFNSARGTAIDSASGTAQTGQIDVESEGGFQMSVTVGVLGQVSICSPTGAGVKVTGYPDC
jgi:type IV fimbrial biogenesis protein FimT